MSVINFKEYCVKTNISMEEGDSSLEPGEVKTPPHEDDEPTNTKQNVVATDEDDDGVFNVKCNKSQNSSHAKFASKQETDKCAEKVRAILELDEIRRNEERERKKEQKSGTLLHKSKNKKKDHKKRKNSKHSKRESRKRKHTETESAKEHGPVKKKAKNKKRKHDEHKSYSSHNTSTESYETMRPISSVALPPIDYSTPPMINAPPANFSHGFSGYNNTRPYRGYNNNPFIRNYRNDFRHRGNDFTPHNRGGRFPRYRSQYNTAGFFHSAPAVEETTIHRHSPPSNNSGFVPSELMWTKTKPSISFTYNILERHSKLIKNKKERKISDRSGGKKKKHKKLKEREHGSNKLSPKLRHKSSKRKKIRQIRKTLQSHTKKQRTLSSSHESTVLTGEDEDGNTPARDNTTPDIKKTATEKKLNSPKEYLDRPIKVEKDVEIEKDKAKAEDSSKSSPVLDMFASLTPPKQKSPTTTIDNKSSTNMSSNIKITNKLQEIQCRVDKLLEDDDLKLESIQATKDKLLQKSREHTDTNQSIKSSSKKNKDKDHSNTTTPPERTLEKYTKQRPKDIGGVSKSHRDDKLKEKTQADTDKNLKKTNKQRYAKEDRELTPPLSLHSKAAPSHSKNSMPKIKVKEEKNFTPPRENQFQKYKKSILSIKTEKVTPPLEDAPSGKLKNSAICTNDSSPDTDDYSDNWENDDEEMLMSSTFLKLNQIDELTKNGKTARAIHASPTPSLADSAGSESNSKIQSTTPKNSPPPQKRLSPSPPPPQISSSTPPKTKSSLKVDNNDTSELSEMQLLYNQFIKSVESADLKLAADSTAENVAPTTSIDAINTPHENEHLSTSSTSYSSSSSSSSSDTSVSSSGSSSTTSSSDSASEDSNDADTLRKQDTTTTIDNLNKAEPNINATSTTDTEKTTTQLLNMKNASKAHIAKEMKKLENLEANLLRIQMMRANYDSADEISDELLKMEKLFLHEKNLILNKFKDTSSGATNKIIKSEKETDSDECGMQMPDDTLQLRGQFVPAMQKLPNEDEQPQVTNIFDVKREVIKLTISPVKLPKTSAIFEADNELDTAKQETEPTENNSNTTVKQAKPIKEVAIVKPIMETKDSSTNHHQKRRRSPLPSHHTNTVNQSRSRSRRGRVRSLSVSPTRNSNNGRCMTPPRRAGGGGGGGGFSKQPRNRNFDRRSRSRSPSGGNRQYNRRFGDISPMSRKRRPLLNVDDRFRKHSPRRDSRSRSRSRSPRHRFDRYSRSPLPFKPPSPPTDPNLSPTNNNLRRSSLSPDRHLRSLSRSPKKRNLSPQSSKSYDNNRHRSLSPKQGFYNQPQQQQQQHSPTQGNTSSYYFNNSPNRISLDARINIVLNGPSSGHNENAHNNTIAGYDDYSHYGQYGPAAYMSLPNDPNGFYANQYVSMANAGMPPIHGAHHAMQQHAAYTNLSTMGNDESNLYTTMQQHANANASNYYYNRFGAQPFGLNQPSPLLKELPKASAVAVQKGNVLEIVPCNDISAGSVITEQQNQNENKKGLTCGEQQPIEEQSNSSSNDKSNRSILKPLDGETNTVRTISVGASKKKKVNFEDGVYPNHNSDEEDRKVIEAKIRVKMRRLRKKLGITPQCQSLLEERVRKNKQKENLDKRAPPPPPPGGMAPPNLEQPIYLRTHTPTPLLYFHFDGVVHSMYVSQMERPIPPRLLNPKCLSTTTTQASNNTNANATAASHHTDSQSPLYMQSPINAAGVSNKKDPIAAFTRPNRNENLSPKVITATTALHQQPAAGSPKLNFKLYSPIDNLSNTEIGNNVTMAISSPNNIKSNTVTHTVSSTTATATTLGANHFLPTKRQESPQQAGISSTRTNNPMGGLLPIPLGHPSMPPTTGITPQTRIPVIGVPPTVIPKMMSSVSEPFLSGGYPSTMMQTTHHPMNAMNIPNSNYQMGAQSMAHTYNPHMQLQSGVQQPFFNSPVQRMHRQLPNYMVQQQQQAQSSPSHANLPMGDHHMVHNMEATNSPQSMTIPFNYKGP